MLSEILARAQKRAQEMALDYSGALTPSEAWRVLQLAPDSKLIDVRSYSELDLVGKIPDSHHVEWAFYPDWKPNPDFSTQLTMQLDKESLVMFICRSGGRSSKAATLARSLGYTEVYNVLEGFEGDTDKATGQRGILNGWKKTGLPWTNS